MTRSAQKTTTTVQASLKTALAVAMVVLSGCAPTAPYQNSASADAVKVEVRGDQLTAQWWTLYAFDNGDTCQGRRVVASSTGAKNVDIRADAGRRQSYMLFLSSGGYMCQIATSFDAKAGNIYSVRVSSDRERCYMATLNTTKTIQGEREPTAVRRVIQTAFVETGSWCAPLNPADVGKPIESTSTNDPNRGQLPKAPDGIRQGTSLDDLKDLLPKQK